MIDFGKKFESDLEYFTGYKWDELISTIRCTDCHCTAGIKLVARTYEICKSYEKIDERAANMLVELIGVKDSYEGEQRRIFDTFRSDVV